MIFPLRTDRRLHHLPWVNLTLIAINVVVFLLQVRTQMRAAPGVGLWYNDFLLDPRQPHWYQFFTYQFLHGSWDHIAFNMLFLYVFGNNLEDRLGPIGYLLYYLTGGVVAGLGHSYLELTPVLGASGAISAVTGAYLALFPAARVTLALWLIFFFDVFEVPSIYIILMSFGMDLFMQFRGGGGVGHVAYLAHITGNLFGFAVGMLLLATRILPREPYDFISMVRHWNRGRSFRVMAAKGKSPWKSDAGAVMAERKLTDQQVAVGELRGKIMRALETQQPAQALDHYHQLVELEPSQVLPRQDHLDLANAAMSDQQYALAAHAYENFLLAYPEDTHADELRLILGLIYARYLQDPARARPLLTLAAERMTDENRKQLALEILAEIEP